MSESEESLDAPGMAEDHHFKCEEERFHEPHDEEEEQGAAILNLERSARCLEMSSLERREMGAAILDYLEGFWSNLDETDAYKKDDGAAEKMFSLPITSSGHDLRTILSTFDEGVVHLGITHASGRLFGMIPNGGIPAAAMADFLASATNENVGTMLSPGGAAVENAVLEWTARFFGFDVEKFGGVITSGGSMANTIGIVAARDARGLRAADYANNVIYMSSEAHYCIQKGLRFVGLDDCVVRRIGVDEIFKIRTDDLRRCLEEDVANGLKPFVIIGTVGTTNTGSIDDISTLSSLATEFSAWLHVDAAFGGFFKLVNEVKDKMAGIDKADSIVWDPHKSLFIPFGTGIVLVKDVQHLLKTHHYCAPYIQYGGSTAPPQRQRNLAAADVSPELCRPFRGLKIWFSLVYHGVKVFEDAITEKLYLARDFHSRLSSIPGVEIGPKPELCIVLFRFVFDAEDHKIDQVNRAIVESVRLSGQIYLTTTEALGRPWIRLAILSFRTHAEDLRLALRLLLRARDERLEAWLNEPRRDAAC